MKTYRMKPIDLEAAKWDGTAEGAAPIIDWILSYEGQANYVGDDEPHYLRAEDEWVESGLGYDIVKPGSPGFIVIETYDGPRRLDPQCWVRREVSGIFMLLSNEEFTNTYYEAPVYEDLGDDSTPAEPEPPVTEPEPPAYLLPDLTSDTHTEQRTE